MGVKIESLLPKTNERIVKRTYMITQKNTDNAINQIEKKSSFMTKRKSGFQFGNIMYSYVNYIYCIISYRRNYITQFKPKKILAKYKSML